MKPVSLEARSTRRRRLALVCGATLFAAVIALLLAQSAFAQSQSFADPAGDAPGGAPDIADISVSPTTDASAYMIGVNLAGATYASDFFLDIYVDTTGDNVAEYLVRLLGNENRIEINRWNGSEWAPFVASILEGTKSLTPEAIRLGRADIGGAQSFNFWLKAWKYIPGSQPACCFDYAGVFRYTDSSGGGSGGGGDSGGGGGSSGGGAGSSTLPPPPPPPPFESPNGSPSGSGGSTGGSGSPDQSQDGGDSSRDTKTGGSTTDAPVVSATAPQHLRGGRRFTVNVNVQHGPSGDGTVLCRATVSRKLTGAATAGLVDGRAACVLKLPAAARGKMARITVDVTMGSQVVRKTILRRVR